MAVVPLAGADRRLLHPSVPIAFFGLAVAAHVATWLLVALFPEQAAITGGPGPGLAAVHMLTLGVLVPTAVGAVLQILPVTTQQAPVSAATGWLVFALLVLGGVLLVGGFLLVRLVPMMVGAVNVAVALLIFAGVLAGLLWTGRRAGMPNTLPAIGLAGLCLVALAVLGGLLAHDYRLAVLPDHAAVAAAHAVLAAYGFMGFLVIGFSHVLVPMLAVAEPAAPGKGRPALVLGAVALALAVAGLLWAQPVAVWAGIAGGLGASLLHVRLMLSTVARRMRRRLGLSFVLVRLSWALLPLSIVAGGLAYAGLVPPALFGVLLLPGWLLTVLLGILQRILPFLASMQTVSACARPASATALVWDVPLKVTTVCHPLALLLLAVGVTAGLPVLMIAAGLVGGIGAIAFLVYAATVGLRAVRHHRTVGPKPARRDAGPRASGTPRLTEMTT